MGRSPAHERGGVWGTGRFPTLSGIRGYAGETWFPPRPRAEGERCSWAGPLEDVLLPASHRPAVVRGEKRPLVEELVLGHRRLYSHAGCVWFAPRVPLLHELQQLEHRQV